MTDIKSSITDLRPKELASNAGTLKLDSQARNIPPAHSRTKSRDPAIQGGKISPLLPVSPRASSPPPLQRPAASNNVRRPATAKGNCKGCGLLIKGKSVSSADGRLTGRYHNNKKCFACQTCNEPFATATFYVLDDAPYCERHYHKLNNSMCHSCDRGIEGQYLETQRLQKFHPTCLTCSDCRRVLKRDYFEMNGKVYCERDAFRRAQQRNFLGPGGATSRMERRTTRLMMMAWRRRNVFQPYDAKLPGGLAYSLSLLILKFTDLAWSGLYPNFSYYACRMVQFRYTQGLELSLNFDLFLMNRLMSI